MYPSLSGLRTYTTTWDTTARHGKALAARLPEAGIQARSSVTSLEAARLTGLGQAARLGDLLRTHPRGQFVQN